MLRRFSRAAAGVLPAPVLWAVAAVVFGCAVQALIYPPLFTADETAHLDYAVQVWHGRLPVFEDGVSIAPPFGAVPPVQWVSQHPPLYYLFLAPIVGPLVDAGQISAAVYAGRAFGIILAAALVVSASVAARWAFPRRPRVPGLTAMIVAATPWVQAVGGAVYNDLLAALASTLLVGAAAKALRMGLTWRRTAALAVLAAAAMASRASTSVVVLVSVATVAVAGIVGRVRRDGRPLGPLVGLCLGGPALVVAAIGWFYLRTYQLTGSVVGTQTEWAEANIGRTVMPFSDYVLSADRYVRLLSVFSYGRFPPAIATLVLLGIPLLVLVLRSIVRRPVGRHAVEAAGDRSVVLCLALAACATVVLQLAYGAGGGGLQSRYMLIVVLPLAVAVACGLLAAGRHWVVFTVLWFAVPTVERTVWLLWNWGRFREMTWPKGPAPLMPSVILTLLAIASTATGLVALIHERRAPELTGANRTTHPVSPRRRRVPEPTGMRFAPDSRSGT